MDEVLVYVNAQGREKHRRKGVGRIEAEKRMDWMRGHVEKMEALLGFYGVTGLRTIEVVGSTPNKACGLDSDIDVVLRVGGEHTDDIDNCLLSARLWMMDELRQGEGGLPYGLDFYPEWGGWQIEGKRWVWECGRDEGEFVLIDCE